MIKVHDLLSKTLMLFLPLYLLPLVHFIQRLRRVSVAFFTLLLLPLGRHKFSVFSVFRLLFSPCYSFRWGVINSASSACFGCYFPLLFLPLGRHKFSVFGVFRLLFFPLLFLPLGRKKLSFFAVFRLLFSPCYSFRWGAITPVSSACFGCFFF